MEYRIGAMMSFNTLEGVTERFEKARSIGLNCCQIIMNPALYTDEAVEIFKAAREKTGIEFTALWARWTGPSVWNFTDGPLTLGLVPPAYRAMRMNEVLAGANFAYKLGITDVITHVGFLPENPNDPDYTGTIAALKHICASIKPRGQYFLFETGQETPITVVRAIHDIGTGNVGINFDTANVILYGKSSAVDSVKIFGKYVRNLHLKDGNFPTDPYNLGKETPLGEGSVNVPEVLKLLKECGYTGPYIMEREISGEKQIEDIIKGRELVLSILKELEE